MSSEFIEGVLLSKKLVTQNQLDMAKFHASLDSETSVADAVVYLGFSTEIEILRAIAEKISFDKSKILSQMPVVNEQSVKDFCHLLAQGVSRARQHCVFEVDEENSLVKVATANPMDMVGRRKTEAFYDELGYTTDFYVVTSLTFALLHKKIYHSFDYYRSNFLRMIKERMDEGDGINQLIGLMFEYAALERTSDIYLNFEKNESLNSNVFFRIDRVKQFKLALPFENAKRLVQSLKQRSGMEAGKIKGHQDGSMEVRILDNRYMLSIRVNSISTISGEQVTMRIQTESRMTLKQLGFYDDHVKKMSDAIYSLRGIVVLSGVTGSGKTTTLYAMISLLDSDAYNIITMEDPVEIKMRNVNQIQINEAAGQSFTETIRAILRQAPDVVLLGEIRDAETAARAVEIAMTGHLVLTTIHANSLQGIRNRLDDLGVAQVERFIEQTTVGIHQDLVAKEGGGLKLHYEIGFDGLRDIQSVCE